MRPTRSLIALAVVVLCQGQPLQAQVTSVAADPLRHAVEKALKTNPEVTARFNAYRAAGDAVDAASGGLLPRLDLSASVGVDRDRITSRLPQNETLNRRGAALTLTQLLWDGLGTQREIDRFGHDRLARYFDLLEATEQTSLEAARALYDVQRFQRLVALAEDNYVQHRYASQQIHSRFRSGV